MDTGADIIQLISAPLPPPAREIAPAGGFAAFPLEVTLIGRVEGGEVRYTLDGAEPAPDSPLYAGPIPLTTSTRVRARVFKDGAPASDEVSALYLESRWNDSLPAAWRETHFGPNWFTRADAAALADADGDNANNLQEWLANTNPVEPGSKPEQPAPLLVLDPPGGAFDLQVTVRVESPVAGAAIRYTLDGTEPGANSPPMVEDRVTLTESATLRARAFFEGNPVSPVVEGAYTIQPVPPRIVRAPTAKAVLAGGNVELEVEAVGTPPLAYQWLFNDIELPGATGRVLRLVEVQPAQAGSYRVRVSNALGAVTSEPAVLTVNQRPQIVRHPESQTVVVGQSVTFTVEAAGTEPLTYEWYRNGVRLSGAPNAPVYTLASVQKTHAGTYHVRVRNAFGSVTSAQATLTVTDQPLVPEITQQPVGAVLMENEAAVLSAAATGTPPLAWQWFLNGQPVPGATGPRLEFASLKLSDAGTYWVEVSNAAGRAVSQPAVLQVRPLQAGGTVNFSNRNRLTDPVIDAPVFEADGVTRLAGPAYLAQLYAGPSPDTLAPVGWAVPFRTGTSAGYVEGGVVVITSVAPGAVAYVQMRAWESARGPDFDSAWRAGGAVGASAVLSLTTGGAGAPPSFPADLVGLSSFTIAREAEPPVVAITSPAPGATADDRFTLAGTVSDNAAVAGATWEWNGRAMGDLALNGGRFAVTGQRLVRGENRFRVTARDTAGNTATAEVLVTYQPARLLSLNPPAAVREGRRVSSDVLFTSPGGVGGLTFVVRYDPEWFRDPELTWADALASALTQVNTQTPGEVRATLSLPGGELPAGTLPLAVLSLRARSVPEALTTQLAPDLADVADRAGAVLDYGNGADRAAVEVLPRRWLGDNNGNDALDVGDASLIQRLIAQLDPVRPWDITGNDLNASQTLDSGDVVKVLRVVVGLDPAPNGPGLARPGTRRLPALAAPAATPPAAAVGLDADRVELWPGERVTVRVRLAHPPTGLSGLSFQLRYPAHALRLVAPDTLQPGPAVPAGVAVLLTADEEAGLVRFAAAGTAAWANSDAPVLELTFEARLSPGLTTWAVSVESGQAAWDRGYEVAALAPVALELRSRAPRLESVTLTEQDGVQLELSTEPGLTYRLEVSEDLRTWEPLSTHVGTGQALRLVDPETSRPARFYRLVVVP